MIEACAIRSDLQGFAYLTKRPQGYPLGRSFANAPDPVSASVREPRRLLAWSRGPLGRPVKHEACSPSGVKSVACGDRTRARNPRQLSEWMRLRNVAFGAAGLAVPYQSCNWMKQRRHENIEFKRDVKKAKAQLKRQRREAAARARLGPSMKPAPVVVRKLDTGEVVPRKRRAKTYARHLDQLARESGYVDYGAYLGSPAWKTLRLRVLTRDRWTCLECGSKKRLRVHHLQYGPLDQVPLGWLVTLCEPCHQKAHDR
jgi:hypothetical protein